MQFQLSKSHLHKELGNSFDNRSSTEETLTIPDEAMTIPYILSRYVQGLPVPVGNTPVNHNTTNFDSPDWEKVKNHDPFETETFREGFEAELKAKEKRIRLKQKREEQKQQQQQAPTT